MLDNLLCSHDMVSMGDLNMTENNARFNVCSNNTDDCNGAQFMPCINHRVHYSNYGLLLVAKIFTLTLLTMELQILSWSCSQRFHF